ncbi:MAG: single-stranded DNA-binding protein [Candidatus Gottesmanbacteria bacterium]|nr:single-stranded DNA-binding protein [Candidatus Gottesmanbacteria bacterium]
MSSRSLNKVQLIGNLTRDPELRYTPTGAAVCTIGLATNRSWTTEAGEKKEETEFHRVVAWNKLAELCSQLLIKGRKIYVEGRLRTNTWQTADGQPRTTTEIVIEDMIILDSRRPASTLGEPVGEAGATDVAPATTYAQPEVKKSSAKVSKGKVEETKTEAPSEQVNPDDIPF